MTERMDIIITETGSRRVRRNIEDIGKSARGTSSAVNGLVGALGSLAGAWAAREVLRVVDTYQNLNNRLKTVTDSHYELIAVNEQLFDIAQKTRTGYESTVEVFARTRLAVKELGVSQAETLDFTRSLNQAVILSGASAAEANNAMIQLSQGLASGTLRGDELRSVLEQLPIVADVIAEGMSDASKGIVVTRGDLRQLGADGEITAQTILDAFRKAAPELAKQFEELEPTIGQAFLVLSDNVRRTVAEMAIGSGAARTLANFMLYLNDNVDTLVRAVTALAYAVGVTFAQKAVGAAIGAVRTLTAVIAANPLGAIAIAITATVSALVAFSDKIKITADGAATLSDAFSAAFEEISALFAGVSDFVQPFVDTITSAVSDATGVVVDDFGSMVMAVASTLDTIVTIAQGVFAAVVETFALIPEALADLFIQGVNFVRTAWESWINFLLISLQEMLNATASDWVEWGNNVITFIEDVFTSIGKGFDALPEGLQEALKTMGSAFISFGDWLSETAAKLVKIAGLAVLGALALVQDAVVGIINYVNGLINTVSRELNDAFGTNIPLIGAVKGGNFAAVAKKIGEEIGIGFEGSFGDGKDPFTITLDRIENPFKDKAKQLGEAAGAAYEEGVNSKFSGASETVERILGRSEEIAQQRLADEKKRTEELAKAKELLNQKGVNRVNNLADENKEMAKRAAKFNDFLRDLQREGELLRLNNDERRIQETLFQAQDILERKLTDSEAAKVTQLVKTNIQLEVQRRLLDEIKGPQEEYAKSVQALNTIYAEGQITAQEYERTMRSLNETIKDPLTDFIEDLQQENMLLALNSKERAIRSALIQADEVAGRSLTEAETAQITALIQSNAELETQNSLLEQIRGPQQEYSDNVAALSALLERGAITAEEYNKALREQRMALLATKTDAMSGFELGLLRIEEQFTDLSDLASDTLVDAFKGAEDALVSFVTTGKVDFKSLIDSMVEDITRLAVRSAITKPLAESLGIGGLAGNLSSGGGGGFLGNLFGGGGGGLFSGLGSFFSGASSFLGGLFPFQHGGSLTVGGNPGIDQNIVSINNRPVAKVSRGERMDFVPAGAGKGSGDVYVNMNITTPDANSFQRSEDQITRRLGVAVQRSTRRNG